MVNKLRVTHESGAIVGSNDDLLTEILRRLPFTSVFRFKSVSKHWHSLLSHRSFTLLYDNVPVSPGLFLHDLYIPFDLKNPSSPPFRTRDFYPNRDFGIMQSCNGLLLCCSRRKYYVVNPTTKKFVIIPSVIGGSEARRTIGFEGYMGLAYHRADLHYKVVCLRDVSRYRRLFQIQIYSSNTGKWRISKQSIHTSDYPGDSTLFCFVVYWNGAMHWIPGSFDLVYFKLDEEKLKMMSLPERDLSSPRDEAPLYFGESGGHLHLGGLSNTKWSLMSFGPSIIAEGRQIIVCLKSLMWLHYKKVD
ncbi:putative F-box domain-containing protein [Helianthus annuus]|nr:putative F-box domain-containing protein [Helianthus annuus]KAJ0774308.1 putative F-box domain-containing protein [Helianthus annuus]